MCFLRNMKTTTGSKAIDRMRSLKLLPDACFGIMFIKENGTVRVFEKCRLRAARRDEGLSISADHYLYFVDMESNVPKTCFKKLIRKVSFPPEFEWLTVKWFE